MRVFLATLLFAAAALAQDAGVYGTWQTEPSGSGAYLHIYIGPCGYDTAKTCGQIEKAANPDRQEIVGKVIITDMRADGPGRWTGGQVWAPDDDKTYRSTMQLSGGALTVTGCVAVFCRSQTWTRAP